MAAALRVFARPLARQLLWRPSLAPASTSASAYIAFGVRGLASKGSSDRPQGLDEGDPSQNPAQDAHPQDSSADGSARDGPSAPLTPPEPLAQALPTGSVPSLDFSPDSPSASGRTGARSARIKDGPTAGQKFAGKVFTVMLGVGLGMTVWNMGRPWDEDELKRRRKVPLPGTSSGFYSFWQRAYHRSGENVGMFREPAWEELLPPPLPAPHQKPYTLLISLDDLLISSTWDRQHGWRTAKRPGVDYFLAYLSQFYELVIFTSQPSFHAAPIVEKLDPYMFYIMYRLFRESTRFVDGHVVKDLNFLNRDLSKVICLDTHAEHISLQPENGVVVKPWDGNPGDSGLVALIPFLESIAIYKPDDVRPILKRFHGQDVPVAWAAEEALQKEQFLAEWHAKNAGRANPTRGLSGGSFTLSGLFGGSSGPGAPARVSNEPLTFLELKRRDAQQQYLDEQAYLKKNDSEIKKMAEDELKERERLAKEAGGSIAAIVGTLLAGPPQPKLPPPGAEQSVSASDILAPLAAKEKK
ncbi:HAD-like protein [Auriculariales sp. MPI-PUGE-AT-0066]|nr:HAD-like protein [Auriculariales sp. MPI-PUGE-AT-0066]